MTNPGSAYLSRQIAGPLDQKLNPLGPRLDKMVSEARQFRMSVHSPLEDWAVSLQKGSRIFPCDGDTDHSFLHNHPEQHWFGADSTPDLGFNVKSLLLFFPLPVNAWKTRPRKAPRTVLECAGGGVRVQVGPSSSAAPTNPC